MTWYDNECGGVNTPLSCETDSVTICPGDDAILVEGTVELGPFTLVALETITVLQGTIPWIVSATNLDTRDLVFATDKVDISGSTVDPIDDYDTFEAQHVTLVPSTDTIITFSSPARLVRISNWDTNNRILVKDGVITSDGDVTAARVGKSPASDVPGQMYFPFATTTINLRSASNSEVTIEGYKGSV